MGTDLKQFDDLINLGRVRKTVVVGAYSIQMHTLSSSEYAKMTLRLGGDEVSVGKKLEALQRELLVLAIDSINGKELSLDEKSLIVGGLQVGLSNLLYEEYGKMVEEQNKILEDSKKNSALTTTG